jgi:hypothetical protein
VEIFWGGFYFMGGCVSSVDMIMVQFEDSLRQRSEVQISIRSSYSEKIFYEKKKFDDLWAHYHHGPKTKKILGATSTF